MMNIPSSLTILSELLTPPPVFFPFCCNSVTGRRPSYFLGSVTGVMHTGFIASVSSSSGHSFFESLTYTARGEVPPLCVLVCLIVLFSFLLAPLNVQSRSFIRGLRSSVLS